MILAILACYLMPHPPIMVPEVGGPETKNVELTIESAETVGREIRELNPDTIVIISPHGPVFQDALCLYDFPLKGSLANFRAPQVKMEFDNDEELYEEILQKAARHKIPIVRASELNPVRYGIKHELDHGVIVPLYFVNKHAKDFRLLPIAFGMISYEDLYAFGRLINEAAENLNRKVVVIASGDLSHRLTADAPAGYAPEGKEFDEKLVSLLGDFDISGLASLKPSLIEKAGECGLRSIWIMLGALDGYDVEPRVLSYEGPFGVGYCIAGFYPNGEGKSRVEELYEERQSKISKQRKNEDVYVRLARNTLETYVKTGEVPKLPDDLPKEMLEERAGVFVTIKKHGELRGCIGTFLPTKDNIAEEIQRNAISAGCEDPRFYPVRPEELHELTYSVDVLTKPEPVKSIDELDPKKYGIIVKKGFRTGLLLPDLEGVDTVKQQLDIALAKAGIDPGEDYQIQKFEVIRHY